jgi:hypothetical protein
MAVIPQKKSEQNQEKDPGKSTVYLLPNLQFEIIRSGKTKC